MKWLDMGKKIFVGNFSFGVDDEKLREHFSRAGTVLAAKVMKDSEGGRSRGFGFVEMSSDDEADRAIAELDGSVWEGRVIKVSEDRGARDRHSSHHEGGEQRSHHHNRDRESHSHSEGGNGEYSRPAPMGYFRAQPLDLGVRKRKKTDPFMEDGELEIDYKNPKLLSRFMSERGRILPRRMTGLTESNKRKLTRAIKRSQHLALLPYVRN